MSEQSSSSIKLVRCIMSKGNGENPVALGSDMIGSFEVYESLESPFMAGKILISDSKEFLNTYPIQGGENIEMEIKTSFNEAPIVYKFQVAGIGSRVSKNKIQTYVLILISPEGLVNEALRVQSPITGNPEAIVAKMLGSEYLDSKKDFYSEPSRFEVRLNPSRTRPFDIISKILRKCVSAKTDYKGNKSTNSTESAQQIKGSAGFFFWETRRGYNFFSIDALCDEKEGKFAAPKLQSESWGPYLERIANTEVSGDQRFLIENVIFTSEINLMESMRKGKYSSLMVFFNHSTGQYEEYVYKIKDSYNNMAHLGGQEAVSLVPANQIELSDYPSRVMSVLLDHESWYNEPGIANPEDENAKDPTKFADWQKYYAAQGAARSELLRNQEATIKIPGNPDICAGDKIDIRLQNKAPDGAKVRKPYDEESSGVYLVKEATQSYNFLEGNTGELKTTLRLCRDSYGMKDKPSNHGDK